MYDQNITMARAASTKGGQPFIKINKLIGLFTCTKSCDHYYAWLCRVSQKYTGCTKKKTQTIENDLLLEFHWPTRIAEWGG